MSYKPKKGAVQPIVLYSEDGTAIEFKYLKQQEKERIVLANKLEVRVVDPEGEDDTGDDGTRMISFPDVAKYKEWDLFITNSHDQDLVLGFAGEEGSDLHVMGTEEDGLLNFNPITEDEEATTTGFSITAGPYTGIRLSSFEMVKAVPDVEEYKKISHLIESIVIIPTETEPTKGSITITLVGTY
jgi:hypothetical protein